MDNQTTEICGLALVFIFFIKTFVPKLNGISKMELKFDQLITSIDKSSTEMKASLEKIQTEIKECFVINVPKN